jgi:hypothetical protein
MEKKKLKSKEPDESEVTQNEEQDGEKLLEVYGFHKSRTDSLDEIGFFNNRLL